jgi:hypothetical protein
VCGAERYGDEKEERGEELVEDVGVGCMRNGCQEITEFIQRC